jgi:hypothetical protein
MADLRPIGSEKLQGMDKLRRIMEIATYRETPKTELNNLSTTNYTIQLSDGNFYGIVKERQGYIIKTGVNESNMDYSDPMKNRKYYRSYSEAMKKLNLIVAETNRNTGNEYEIPLIGEQPEVKKKFVLKTAKKAEPAPDMAAPAPEAPAPDMSSPAPETPAPDMGAPAPEMGGDTDMGMAPEMGGDTDMGMGPEMGGEETPEMPMAPGDAPMLDTEVDVEDEEEGGPSTLKLIQKLTGKLSQKLRTFDKDKGLDSQDIKYVMNSIISAINLSKLDDDDREDIVDKLEGFDGYGEDEGELDLQGDEELNFGLDAETAPEGTEEVDFEETEMMPEPETKEGYQTVMDSIFGESKIEKVLSNYFQIKDEEKPIIENKNKMDYLKNKIVKITQKEEVSRLSVSESQTKKSLVLLEEYSDSKLLGKTNKNNLVFRINGREVKVTPNGQTL